MFDDLCQFRVTYGTQASAEADADDDGLKQVVLNPAQVADAASASLSPTLKPSDSPPPTPEPALDFEPLSGLHDCCRFGAD